MASADAQSTLKIGNDAEEDIVDWDDGL